MRTRLVVATGLALMLGVSMFFTGSPAYADASPAIVACPSGDVCLYPNAGFGGQPYRQAGNDSNYTQVTPGSNCPGTSFNDCASSVINNGRSCAVYMWTNINYKGRWHSLSIGDRVENFGDPNTGYRDPAFNDQVSSHHWCTPN